MPGAIHPSQSVPLFPRVPPRAAIVQGAVACAFALSSVFAAGRASAQSAPQSSPSPTASSTQNPALPHVNTTVVVHGDVKDDYLSNSITAGTLSGLPLSETPLSALAITEEQLSDQQARLLSDVVKNDASVGEDYAPVGYYGDYEIRGFPIDLATGLEINGMTIAGEQDVPLENKERVEIVNGIAGAKAAWHPRAASSTMLPRSRPRKGPRPCHRSSRNVPLARSILGRSSVQRSRLARGPIWPAKRSRAM